MAFSFDGLNFSLGIICGLLIALVVILWGIFTGHISK